MLAIVKTVVEVNRMINYFINNLEMLIKVAECRLLGVFILTIEFRPLRFEYSILNS